MRHENYRSCHWIMRGDSFGNQKRYRAALCHDGLWGVGILACLDTVLGGVRADMEHQFQMRIFVSGFFINGIVAIGLVWLGKQLNMDLSIAAIVVFGSRIFYNFSKIRRFLLNKRQKEAMIGEE